jgi:hypothetical protein
MNQATLAAAVDSWWFRMPVLLAALAATVALGPWMLLGAMLTPSILVDGEAVAASSLVASLLGAGGLLGLLGLWLALLLPGRVLAKRPRLRIGVTALLAAGIAAALGGAAYLAIGGVWGAAMMLLLLSAAGGVILAGRWWFPA